MEILNSKLILLVSSELYGRDLRPARARPARGELRAHQGASPALAAARDGHVPHDDGKDGRTAHHWRPARPGDDQGWLRAQGREGSPVCYDVPERHADCCKVRP